jgi:hypothetical protein
MSYMLLAAFTESQPHALLRVRYRDLDLYVERDKDTNTHEDQLVRIVCPTFASLKASPKPWLKAVAVMEMLVAQLPCSSAARASMIPCF